jgi:hypothetical protein
MVVLFAGLRADLAPAFRGLAVFAATRLAAAFFARAGRATFADFLVVLPAIVFTPE